MESLYLLVPLSVGVILAMLGVFAWALNGGQFDDLAAEGERVLLNDPADATVSAALDVDQARQGARAEE